VTARPHGDGRIRPCPRCGALNGADFSRCVRCNAPLSSVAVGAERLASRLDGQRLLATKLMMGLTTLVFAGQLGLTLQRMAAGEPGAIGALLFGGHKADMYRVGALTLDAGDPVDGWRLLSAVFVHFGLLHYGLNMLGLMNLSRVAEPAIGSARYLITYVLTGLAGFVASALWTTQIIPRLMPDPALVSSLRGPIYTAGASGAVFGVMGLILGMLVRRRNPLWKKFAVEGVLYSLMFGLVFPVNNAAHIGGLLAGILFGVIYAGERRRRWLEPLINATAVLCLVACLASLAIVQLQSKEHRLEQRPQMGTAALVLPAAPAEERRAVPGSPGAVSSAPTSAPAPADGGSSG